LFQACDDEPRPFFDPRTCNNGWLLTRSVDIHCV
jgi:hypothetical protein